MIDNQELGFTPNNLKNLRQKFNLTQKDLAKILNVSCGRTVSKWETGYRDMPYKKWLFLIQFLKENNQK